ncbi:hypothetical protein [Tenacibaculum maritimum]|uniref:hypothetical protein n=1 Tax=Tenacibaculum maritimum TaxID=107401 RepID=UPI0038777C42
MKQIKFEFECRVCKEIKDFTEPQFIAHLDIKHSEIENSLRTELICDFGISKLNKEIEIKTKELSLLKQNLNKLRIERKNTDLKILKDKVLLSLKNSDIDEKSLEIIESRKSVHKLKVYLTRGLNKKFRKNLEDFKIDYFTPLIKKKPKSKTTKKKKLKKEKEYHDRTTNSIRPIYTPMGNKR